eukprot:4404778-Amphidinium_carterae.1
MFELRDRSCLGNETAFYSTHALALWASLFDVVLVAGVSFPKQHTKLPRNDHNPLMLPRLTQVKASKGSKLLRK